MFHSYVRRSVHRYLDIITQKPILSNRLTIILNRLCRIVIGIPNFDMVVHLNLVLPERGSYHQWC